MIEIPQGAQNIIDVLNKNNYEGYVVGGCVRDSILGRTPHDWDICTNATPEQVISCFPDRKVIETGIKHGTVTILDDDDQYEVTTYRVDGEYIDNRHPETVRFVTSLKSDLARRDFTMNAIAYNEFGFTDPSGGIRDLLDGVVRCVGIPDERFQEDALRLLRALRFASVYGFTIEENTAASIHKNRLLLKEISAERIREELSRMLLGKNIFNILMEYQDIMTVIIPELNPCIGFPQNSIWHCYDVYEHTAHAVANYASVNGADANTAFALLFHDLGKPSTCTTDNGGNHFPGHGKVSAELAENIMHRLKFDTESLRSIHQLVLYHDAVIEPTEKVVKRWMNKINIVQLHRLMEIRKADVMAQADYEREVRIQRAKTVMCIARKVLQENQCYQLKTLAVNGSDIMRLGIPEGKRVGKMLNLLLTNVIDGYFPNNKEALLSIAERIIKYCDNLC